MQEYTNHTESMNEWMNVYAWSHTERMNECVKEWIDYLNNIDRSLSNGEYETIAPLHMSS